MLHFLHISSWIELHNSFSYTIGGWLNYRRTRAIRGLLATGLVIKNRGQVTRPTPELAPNATLQRHRTRRQDIGLPRFNEHVYPSVLGVFLLDFGSIFRL